MTKGTGSRAILRGLCFPYLSPPIFSPTSLLTAGEPRWKVKMSIGEIIGVGGPIATVAAIFGFFINAWLQKRKDDREEIRSKRDSESGIVETTGQALRLVREQMSAMGKELKYLRAENDRKEQVIKQLIIRVNHLEQDNYRLQRKVET